MSKVHTTVSTKATELHLYSGCLLQWNGGDVCMVTFDGGAVSLSNGNRGQHWDKRTVEKALDAETLRPLPVGSKVTLEVVG